VRDAIDVIIRREVEGIPLRLAHNAPLTSMGKSPYFQRVSTVVSGDYEWNEAKAKTNLAKHGVSFDEAAAALASDPDELTAPDPLDRSRTLSLVMSLRARVLLVVTTEAGVGPASSALERRNPMSNASTTRKRESESGTVTAVDFSRAKRIRRPRKGSERVSLRSAREAMGMTQAEMARAIGTDQGEVSRIERRPHVRFSTLRKYAEALGARCDVAFVFPDGRHLLVEVDTDEPPR
jgi:uncharacterized DUF497 family protein/DNA-binding XRE family transcriptional regulator